MKAGADTGADCGAHAEPHCAEAAARDEGARLFELVVLCRPHLVLTDIGGHDVVAVVPAVRPR